MMETQLSEDLDTSKADMQLYPTPEQQRDVIKKIENDKTAYSYFVCRSWYHQWKAHVNYDDLGSHLLDDIVTQQPIGEEKEILKRRATCRGPGLAVAASQNEEEANEITNDNPHDATVPNHKTGDTETANQILETVNSTNDVSSWENTDDTSPILASSTPIKSTNSILPKDGNSTLLRNKPKLTRVCRNSSRTEIDSSFEASEEISSSERGRPINPLLAGLRGEGRKEGEKPDANASITEIFEQAKDRQVKMNSDQANSSADSGCSVDMQMEEGEGCRQQVEGGEGRRQGSLDKHVTFSMKPGPLERDTDNDQNNILVNENVWMKLVQWYGISESHDLGRAFTNADKNCFEDFGVSLLSPVMTFIERPVRSLNIRDEAGYVELQVRKLLRVPAHKSTRLWIREKEAKSKLKPLLDRSKSLGEYQEELKCDLSCILALEIMDLEGLWPTGYPGTPLGRFDKYLCVAGHQTAVLSWEQQLEGAILDIVSKMPANQKALVSAITMTTKHILETTKADMEKAREEMDTRTAEFHMMAESLKCKLITVQEKDKKLTSDVETLKVREEEFRVTKKKFEAEIAQMKDMNKIAENQVKLDIGGHQFLTSSATLTSDPESLLGTMFSGVHPIRKEQDGSYFIDRDGSHFRYVLNFLREGVLGPIEPANQNTLLELLAEAEYYKIEGLITAVKDFMIKEGMNINTENGPVPERTPSKIPLRRLYEKGQSISSDPIL